METPVNVNDENEPDPFAMYKRPRRVDEATEQLNQLKQLVADGKISLKIDQKRLTHMDSPVVCDPDSTRWLYALAVVAAVVWWRLGTTYGLVAIAVAGIIYATLARTYVKRRLERRSAGKGAQRPDDLAQAVALRRRRAGRQGRRHHRPLHGAQGQLGDLHPARGRSRHRQPAERLAPR